MQLFPEALGCHCYQRHCRRSGVFIVKFEHTSHPVLVFLMLCLSRLMPDGWVLK